MEQSDNLVKFSSWLNYLMFFFVAHISQGVFKLLEVYKLVCFLLPEMPQNNAQLEETQDVIAPMEINMDNNESVGADETASNSDFNQSGLLEDYPMSKDGFGTLFNH